MEEKAKKKKISKKRRINAMLYPVYKAFSWDLLCFYSVEFLFYTITKKGVEKESRMAVINEKFSVNTQGHTDIIDITKKIVPKIIYFLFLFLLFKLKK